MPKLLRTLALFGLVCVAGSSEGCTFALNFTSTQCSTPADCYNRGPTWGGYTCGPDNVCIKIASYCDTNKECNERAGGSGSYICKKSTTPGQNACVNLLGNGCTDLISDPDDLLQDDAVVIGLVMMPDWNPNLHDGVLGASLARKDFTDNNTGITPRPGGGKRPIVILSCGVPVLHQEQHQALTDHLVKDVSPPVIIGYLTNDEFAYAVNLTKDRDILIMSPFEASGAIEASNGLLFTIAVDRAVAARTDNDIIGIHEGLARAPGPEGDGKTGDLKLAIVGSQSSHAERIASLEGVLKLNGKSYQENFGAGSGQGNILIAEYGASTATTDPQLAAAIGQVTAFKPDIVICYGIPCSPAIEQWESDWAPAKKTRYVLTSTSIPDIANAFTGRAGVTDADYARVLGQHDGRQASDPRISNLFQRFTSIFQKEISPDPSLGAFVYDMMYEAAYALSALGDKPTTGRNVADVIRTRFVPGGQKIGTVVNGPADIQKGVNFLGQGQNLELDGSLGVGMYGPDSRRLVTESVVWCLRAPKQPGASGILDSGYIWRSDTGLQLGPGFSAPTCL